MVMSDSGELAFFVYCFTKSNPEHLRRDEFAAFLFLANEFLALDRADLAAAHTVGVIVEVLCHAAQAVQE